MRSLDFLCQSRVHGLLVHHADLMLRPGSEYVADALHQLREDGLVTKIGVSVYDGAELDAVLDRFDFDLVQVPVSVADQRFVISGQLTAMKNRGVEIHARSVFLQGLLLMTPKELPDGFPPTAAPSLARFVRACAKRRQSPLEACLEFVLAIREIDCLLVGVNQAVELAQIVAAVRGAAATSSNFAAFAFADSRLLNPVHWV
jgi:aryl-alcohol dehydrogenase-like predicted oxidoreductase